MSLATYKLFCTIAEQKNMAQSAELLHITPSAATHAMNSLEKTLGFTLLNRDRRGVTLTAYGEMLLPRFRAILQEEENLQEEISQINGLEKGCVRIGVFDSVCTSWLPTILGSFKKKYPRIEVQVYQGGYQDIEDKLKFALLDMGFVSLPTSDQFNTITLLHDRLLCVAPQDYFPKTPPYVTPNDLRQVPLIIAKRGYDRNISDFFEQNQLFCSQQHNIASESSAIAMVEAGMGCSIFPELALKIHPGNYKVFPLINNEYRTIALATLKEKRPSLAGSKMIQEIRSILETYSTLS
ncbi:MAG: LysR family transcriptional regulator [Lawsonibacter sp.]|nr:LysR family transcriptional regulator [Lawsonibacter sp.]